MKKIENKTLYTLTEFGSERSFPIYVMQSIGFRYSNSIIKYESVDDSGGEVTNAGSLIQELPITFYLIGNLSENLATIKKLKHTRSPFTLFTNIDTADLFGSYLLESIDAPIMDGTDAIIVNCNLVEYRTSSLNQRNFTISATKTLDNLLNFLKNQNQIDKR